MIKYGKVWGETFPILETKSFELHKIKFKDGHMCSEHMHNTKFNAFICLKGLLLIRVWKKDYDLVDETVIEPNQVCVVKPGEYHQFEALSDGEALEIYWSEFDANDIVRRNVGE